MNLLMIGGVALLARGPLVPDPDRRLIEIGLLVLAFVLLRYDKCKK